MNTRGLTELIILNAAVSLGVLDGRMFTMLVIVALVTTAMVGPLLSRPLPPAAPAARGSGPDVPEKQRVPEDAAHLITPRT